MSEQRQNRKREGGGFSGAGLGGADQIFAGENNGEGAKLDRGRLGKTHRLHAAHHFERKVEIVKTHVWKLPRDSENVTARVGRRLRCERWSSVVMGSRS